MPNSEEVEITPAMIEAGVTYAMIAAGVAAFAKTNFEMDSFEEIVAAVYLAMKNAETSVAPPAP